MRVESRARLVLLAVALGGLWAGVAHPTASVHAAPPARFAATPERPPQGVAYARIALVRVLAYYNGTVSSDSAPIPWPSPCAADGVLIGTTGDGLNSFDYVLLPTAAVNPITPCTGVQASFAQLNGRASGWSLEHVDVLLSAAYTGTSDTQLGSILYRIDPGQIATNGGPAAPSLLALALTPSGSAPSHDVPVLSTPQPSDTPPDPAAAAVLDLTRQDGQLLGRDALTGDEPRTALYPVGLPAGEVVPGAQPTAAGQTTSTKSAGSGGTVAPPTATAATLATETPLTAKLGLGAAEIDGNGRLIGMLAVDGQGHRGFVSLAAISRAIGPVSSQPGSLMMLWQQGTSAFYAAPPQFQQAANAFGTLATTYPDFGGVQPFKSAAVRQSTAIPSLTSGAGGTRVVPETGRLSGRELAIVGALAAVLVVVLLAAMVVLVRRSRRAHSARASASGVAADDEALLDLLPSDLPLQALQVPHPPHPPMPQPPPQHALDGMPARNGIEQANTVVLPAASPARPMGGRPRNALPLMPYAAGATHPGVRRAADPNQDNLLALHGTRSAGGRPQTYGLFIVADGMGGHVHGQEASRVAIEMVAASVLQPLSSVQDFDESALKALVRDSMRRADQELRQRNAVAGGDMGTTMTAALVVDDLAIVGNVGDSRTYRMSPEHGLGQVTTDHSVVASLAAAGVIRPEDIYTHPRRNQIFRSLGGQHDETDVDVFVLALQAGDKLLLCSDGLWEMVRDPQIESILRGTADPQRAVELLVREANANGGEDNIGVIVVRLVEEASQPAQPGMRVLAAPQELHLPWPM
ncbi:MAG TPA: protein phosphatase 2C domain-containing protein [Ktedonobacterales bacterium]|nr:protein phosphatase 2C domain-containing protein [Ktedonobacterales bacterium]